LGQVIAFAVDTRLDDSTLLAAINAHLPGDIALQSLSTTNPGFDPRRSATRREYHYLVVNRSTQAPLLRGRAHWVRSRLDLRAMRAAAQTLVGIHDFSAFATPAASDGMPVREIYDLDVASESDLVRFRVVGSGFMQHMIRTIVGTLLLVGSGNLEPAEIGSILASRDRNRSANPVPAHGLYLVSVSYDDSSQDQPAPESSRPTSIRQPLICNS